MKVVQVSRSDELDRFAFAWDELVDKGANVGLFQTREWLVPWLSCFWKDKPIAFAFVFDGARPIGLAPLLRDNDGELACSATLHLPVNDHAIRSSLLHVGDAGPVLRALLDHVSRTGGPKRLELEHLDPSVRDQYLQAVQPLGHHGVCMRDSDFTTPIIRIHSTWSEYLDTRSRHLVHEIRRKVKHGKRMGATAQVFCTPEQCEQALPYVMQIEARSWKQAQGTSFTADPAHQRFYSEVARGFAQRGWLRLYILYIDNRPVAHIYGAEFRNEYCALKTSYDASFRQSSPGTVLFAHALEDAFTRKLSVFDFLGVESRWKLELANDQRTFVDLCVFPRANVRCQLCRLNNHVLHQQIKPYLQRNAPAVIDLKRNVDQHVLVARKWLDEQVQRAKQSAHPPAAERAPASSRTAPASVAPASMQAPASR